MKALVTGSDGFIGSNMVSALKRLGHEVLGLDTGNCDLNDPKAAADALRGFKPDTVFHFAALLHQTGEDAESRMFANNTVSTLNILKASVLSGTKKFIFSSTMNVYGRPKYLPVDEKHPLAAENVYGISKVVCEQICGCFHRTRGIDTVILRYSGVFGKGRKGGAISAFIDDAVSGKELRVSADDRWDTLIVDDIVKANLLASEKAGKIGFDAFNIGCGKPIQVTHAAKKVVELTGSASKIGLFKNADKIDFYYDITKAKKVLGFIPEPFEKALARYVGQKMKGGA